MAVAGALWLILAVGPGAAAHALRTASQPNIGQDLSASPAQIEITFTETPDRAHSFIEVLDTSGRIWAKGAPSLVPGQPATVVAIPVPNPLPKGVYTVNWKTISSVDGHLATGSFAFGVQTAVTGAASTAAVVKSPTPSSLTVVSRFLYLTGLIGLLGLIFTEVVVIAGTDPPRRLRQAVWASWLLAVFGPVGIAQAQRGTDGIKLGATLSSSIGHALLLRDVPVLVVGVALVFLAAGRKSATRHPTGSGARRGLWVDIAGIATLASMLADVLKSHADATNSWVWFRVGTQWIHFAAAGVWIGGLAGLLICLGPLGSGHRLGPTRRFSFWAGVSIVVVGVTGTLRALDEVGSWHGLLHTGFGQLIVVKIVLFGALAALGALNRYRHVGLVETRPRSLRRAGGGELVAMAAVLVATSVLQNLTPASTSAASAAPQGAASSTAFSPIVARATDFADTYRMTLTISPGTAGFNTFNLALDGYTSRKPVRVTSVSIGFAYPNNPGVGASSLTLVRQGNGAYQARSANMSLVGQWNLTITVENGTQGSVEVPIDVVTESPAQPDKVQSFPGSPTTYTISLAGGNQVQIYADPLNQGVANFHATFFAPSGQEIAMQPTLAVDAATSPGGNITTPWAYSFLDSIGHFVAHAKLPAGTYQFNVVGTTVTGTALGATVVVPITK